MKIKKFNKTKKRKGGNNNIPNYNSIIAEQDRQPIPYIELVEAIRTNSYGVLRLYIQEGGNMNLRGGFKADTLLMTAIYMGVDMDMIKFLVENGAKPELTDRDGYSAVSLAHAYNELDLARYLTGYCGESCETRLMPYQLHRPNSIQQAININENNNQNNNENYNSENSENNPYYWSRGPPPRRTYISSSMWIEENSNNNSNNDDIRNRRNNNNNNNNNIKPRNNVNNSLNIGTCFDPIMNNNAADPKEFLKEDINNIILLLGKKLICLNRKQIKKYTQMFYECRNDTGSIGDNNVIKDVKYGKLMPYNQLVSQEELDKIQDKKYSIFSLKEERSAKAFVSVEVKNRQGSFVSADHCQTGSGGKIYSIKAYTLSEASNVIKNLNKTNGGRKLNKSYKKRK
jgi:hypothetical protein